MSKISENKTHIPDDIILLHFYMLHNGNHYIDIIYPDKIETMLYNSHELSIIMLNLIIYANKDYKCFSDIYPWDKIKESIVDKYFVK